MYYVQCGERNQLPFMPQIYAVWGSLLNYVFHNQRKQTKMPHTHNMLTLAKLNVTKSSIPLLAGENCHHFMFYS